VIILIKLNLSVESNYFKSVRISPVQFMSLLNFLSQLRIIKGKKTNFVYFDKKTDPINKMTRGKYFD
jgi:hypothetical protein